MDKGERKISSHNTLVILDSYFEGKGMKQEKIKLVPWVKLSFVTKCELGAYRCATVLVRYARTIAATILLLQKYHFASDFTYCVFKACF